MSDKINIPMHVLESLRDIKKSPYQRTRIDEATFKNRWLPLFNAASHEGLAPLGDWVQQVAGNPFREVEVIKDGNVLFVVPPILNSNIDIFKAEADIYLDTELDTARREGAHFAIKGKRHFETAVLNNLNKDLQPSDYSTRMDKIFEHYGLTRTKKIATPTSNKPGQTDDPNEKLSVDFEDY